MGLFGSRTKTSVGTSVTRLVEDDMVPNSVRSGALRSILKDDGQLIENAMEELSTGLATRVRRMHRYGKNHYIHGLPSGTTMTNLMGEETIAAAIAEEVGPGVDIDYYHFGPANLLHLGWVVLVRDYGYNSVTNSMTVAGKTVYLSDMVPVIAEASVTELENGSLDSWGKPPNAGATPANALVLAALSVAQHNPFIVDPAVTADCVRVKYCWEEEVAVLVEGVSVLRKTVMHDEMTLPLTGFDLAADYHQACYMRAGAVSYWAYREGSGLNPAVEAIFETTPQPTGTFFPFAYFRFDKKSTAEDPETEEYKSTHKLLKTMNMDFADIAGAINENPDIGDVEQAMLMMAVPAFSDEPVEQQYLFDFFNNLWLGAREGDPNTLPPEPERIRNLKDQFGIPRPPTTAAAIVIQDKKFKMALSWDSLSKQRVAGSIGKVGTHAAVSNINEKTKPGVTVLGVTVEVLTVVPTFTYRHQITEGLYEEIQVVNLKMTYHIWGNYTATGGEDDDILLVPLDYAIIKNYSMPVRERLTARAMHFVFNSRVTVKLKWYQTGIFKVFIIIIAVVAAFWTYGTSLKAAWALLAAGAYMAATIILLSIALEYLIMTFLVKLFVKVVGAKIAFIAALALAIYGGYVAYQAGSVAGAPFAQQLLSLSTSLTNKSIQVYLEGEYNDLKVEADLLKTEQEARMEQLERANDLLNDSYLHLAPLIVFGESPDDFYQRTVHSGNIGIVGIEAVASYVDIQLMLPKISDTLGEYV